MKKEKEKRKKRKKKEKKEKKEEEEEEGFIQLSRIAVEKGIFLSGWDGVGGWGGGGIRFTTWQTVVIWYMHREFEPEAFLYLFLKPFEFYFSN